MDFKEFSFHFQDIAFILKITPPFSKISTMNFGGNGTSYHFMSCPIWLVQLDDHVTRSLVWQIAHTWCLCLCRLLIKWWLVNVDILVVRKCWQWKTGISSYPKWYLNILVIFCNYKTLQLPLENNEQVWGINKAKLMRNIFESTNLVRVIPV